ncbi:restriction endonuclease subunit S [Anaerolinea sp.]|uniref:restriction endonuclease subunit S n=1 Tax=Anaerolinea sp. TaxID=1872519 RepID=UPI002ACE79E8|nr:restriction endonuclease subunit S [Anaerolinea sp.]
MTGEWPKVAVSDVAIAVIGGTPSRSVPAYWDGDIPWATAKDIANTAVRYLNETQEFITEEGLENSAAKLLPTGTVVITARGTVGAIAQLGREMTFNQTCYALIPKEGLDNNFLFYVLKGTIAEMQALTYGTVFETITTQSFNHWIIPFPPLPEQRSIAHILGTLDDKIELNRRMSETLEAMARALFKSWFVDFDPVRAKMEGRWRKGESLLGLPAHLYDLFPDRLVDSELGQIPEGWEVGTLGQLMELAYGRALKEENRKLGRVPVYGSNGQIGWHDEALATGPGIVVGRKGNPGIVTWVPTDFFAIDTTFYVVPKEKCRSLYFLFFALSGHDLPSLAADSAVPGLNRNFAYSKSQVIPSSTVLDAFDEVASALFERQYANNCESRTLAALRDALLPKLISGELRVKDAERFLKERGL